MIGDALRSHTDGRQAAEVAIAVQVLNHMLELGGPEYVCITWPAQGQGSARPRQGLPDLVTGDLRPNGGMKVGAALPRDQTRLAVRQLDNAPGSVRPAAEGKSYSRGARPETPVACSRAASPSR